MKKTKKLLPLLCAALASVAMLGLGSIHNVHADAQTYTITGTLEENYTAEVGQEVTIPLQISSDYDMRGVTGKLNGQYDDTVLEFEKAEYTDGIPAGLESVAGGNFGFMTTGTFKTGTVNLIFKVLKCAKDPVELTIKDLYATVQIETEDGKTDTKSTERTTLSTTVTVNHPEDQLEKTVTKEATCLEKGARSVTCKLCGADLGTEEIPALGHDFGEATIVKEATCTATGTKKQTCKRCGKEVEESIPQTVHVSDEGKVTKEATCTEEGEKTYSCKVCGALIKTEKIAKTAHVSDGGKVTKEPTCAKEGEKTYSCKNCGAVIKTEKIAKTTEHTWKVATDTDKDGWKVVKKATSTTEGSKERVCSVCGKKETKAIAKIAAAKTTGKLKLTGGKSGTTTGTATGTTKGGSAGSSSGSSAKAAETGDTANAMGMFVLLFVAAAVLSGAVTFLIRRRRKA